MMMSVHEWTTEVTLCVTYGAEAVARYGFLCRATSKIGQRTYLGEGVTEEQHLASINGLFGRREMVCSDSVMREIFNDEEMVLLYRFSFEMEKARRSLDLDVQPPPKEPVVAMSMSEDSAVPEVGQAFYARQNRRGNIQMEGFDTAGIGSPVGPLPRASTIYRQTFTNDSFGRDQHSFIPNWGDVPIGPGYWENMLGEGYVLPSQSGFNVSAYCNVSSVRMGHDLSQETKIVDVEGSSTGSSGGKDVNQNEGMSAMVAGVRENNQMPNVEMMGEEPIPGFGCPEAADMGNPNPQPDGIEVGMVFKNREEFKQHMAITCSWRVYAVLLKNTALYEIRTIEPSHTCSLDDRSGYQTQATHTVIGGILRAQFAGGGAAPRPNEIRQAMRGNHVVHISYWKAWRFREVALDYAKGTCGTSYNLLPGYLEKLIHSNPGTITAMHTEYAEGIGHKFKYMFLALEASIEGYKSMRKVVIVDGTHLRGKYSGCLLTASAQDGNYQVFPLAVAVVDGENDKSWEWFLKNLTQFIPNEDGVVFVSDRHPSIYYALHMVYPEGKHCACVLHLKRNIRTHFKDKHLGYLVGKAARAYRLSEFYKTFNEIKRVNASCADYLVGIGFEHWARSHFSGDRYNVMISNVAETWNSVLRETREFPILSLIEYIRSKLMHWFSLRRQIKPKGSSILTPRAVDIMTAIFENSGAFTVSLIETREYEVKDRDGDLYHVSLNNKSCTCYEFQALMIPCTHAIAAATRYKVPVDTLADEYYSLAYYREAYSNPINPVVDIENVETLTSDNSDSVVEINPPTSRRPPGRPRKTRIFSRGEYQVLCVYT
ncbi:hypothetical protein Bca101_082684 [Brassica carinata]